MQTLYLVCLLLVTFNLLDSQGMSHTLMYNWCGILEVFCYIGVDYVDFHVKVIGLMWNDTEFCRIDMKWHSCVPLL